MKIGFCALFQRFCVALQGRSRYIYRQSGRRKILSGTHSGSTDIGWIEIRDDSGAGTGKLVPPSVEAIRAQLFTEVSDMRRRVEGGGIVLPSGAVILTGLDDQNRVSAALASMERFNIDAIDFKAASGWVKLTVAELAGIGAAIAAHVQNCFSAERRHHEAIAAQIDLDALAGYDTSQGWPGNEAWKGTQNGEESA